MKEFDAIFKEFTPLVYHFLLSLCGNESLVEELTSETFYQAYLHIGQFRGDCKIETWLCQIAKNALIKSKSGAAGLPVRIPWKALLLTQIFLNHLRIRNKHYRYTGISTR